MERHFLEFWSKLRKANEELFKFNYADYDFWSHHDLDTYLRQWFLPAVAESCAIENNPTKTSELATIASVVNECMIRRNYSVLYNEICRMFRLLYWRSMKQFLLQHRHEGVIELKVLRALVLENQSLVNAIPYASHGFDAYYIYNHLNFVGVFYKAIPYAELCEGKDPAKVFTEIYDSINQIEPGNTLFYREFIRGKLSILYGNIQKLLPPDMELGL